MFRPLVSAIASLEEVSLVLPRREGVQLRPDAVRCELLSDHELSPIMEELSRTLKASGTSLRGLPLSVYVSSVASLIHEWKAGEGVLAARVSDGSIVVRSRFRDVMFESNFAILDAATCAPRVSGFVTDRGVTEQWPTEWSDYSGLRGRQLLDVCCGGGAKVRELREQGVDAHGVDIGRIGHDNPAYLHFGRAEHLPFVDQSFDRVETRMGAIWMQQESIDECRNLLAEMIRVTRDGGSIRIFPTREDQLQALVAERNDAWLYNPHFKGLGCVEVRVRRGGPM